MSSPASATAAAPAPLACGLKLPSAPTPLQQGVVTGLEDRSASLARIPRTEALFGGKIDPAYVDNQRVTVRLGDGQTQLFLMPRGSVARLGDRVMTQDSYRNLNLACNYVPPLVTADLGAISPPSPASPSAP